MDQHQAHKRDAAADREAHISAYVPPLQRTEGQPAAIAANGGLSYMSFDRERRRGHGRGDRGGARRDRRGRGPARHRPDRPRRARARSRRSGASASATTPNAWPISARATSTSPKAAWRCRWPTRSTSGRPTPSSRRTRCGATRRARTWRSALRKNEQDSRRRSCFSRRCYATRGASARTTRDCRPPARTACTNSASRWRTWGVRVHEYL